nr:acetolactate synthase small subunit [Campylobacter sp.]
MACDSAKNIDNFIKVMRKYNPIQIVRSGSVMMEL